MSVVRLRMMMNSETAGPHLAASPVVQQVGSMSSPRPGGQTPGAPDATGFTTYQPRTRVEFVDLNKQLWQKQGETLAVWLLQLWDRGVGPAPMGGFVDPY